MKTDQPTSSHPPAGNIYVASDLAGLLRRFIQQEGIQAPAVQARLSAHPANSRMPMQEWWHLLEAIQQAHPVAALGVRIGQCIQPKDSGALGYLVMHCKTVGEALVHFQRYQALLHNMSELEMETKEDRLRLSWSVEQGLSTQLSDEVFLSGLICFMQQITNRKDVQPTRIEFTHQVSFPHQAYETLLGCPIEFGQPRVAIEIPFCVLEIAINSHNPWLLSLLEQQAQAIIDPLSEDELLNQIRQWLAQAMSQGNPTLTSTAKALHLSTRSLHRRLEQHGLNFQTLLRDTRKQLAGHYLADPSLSLSEISFLLGYSEQSAFNRAFRQWFGLSPKRYQQQQKAKTSA